jgi:crotonobetainyl-CoA:carnitine CoA-transferase CaiB-like acyl-CoA transferase
VALPLAGFTVVELASWVMGPTAGGVLAEWGADVIKVEPPATGDPVRHLRHRSAVDTSVPLNVNLHHANRSKRSIGIDVATDAGHALLMRLVERGDVFLTNYLPAVRAKLRVDVADVQAVNPRMIYARSTALGPRGPENHRAGYDYATFWCRTGIADALFTSELSYPPVMASGGMGDMTTGAVLAGAISAALLKRERTGEASVVDVSLLATGAWMMGLNVAAAAGGHPLRLHSQADRDRPANPLVNIFRTKDDRFLALCLLQTDWAWPELCDRIGRPDLAADTRFSTHDGLMAHSSLVTAALDDVFRTATLTEWQTRLHNTRGVWETVQDLSEVAADGQMLANGYLQALPGHESVPGAPTHLVSAPAQFDETAGPIAPAPELGQHTEELLLELGCAWDDIVELKEAQVIT